VDSCGSLDSSSSLGDEQLFEQAIQALSSSSSGLGMNSSFRTRNKFNSFHTPAGKIDQSPLSFGLGMNSSLQTRKKNSTFQASSAKIDQLSSSLGLGTSSSFQTKRKFNSFQATPRRSDQLSRNPISDSSLGDLPRMFQHKGNISRKTNLDGISHMMKLKLRRELGLNEQSKSS